MHTRREVLRLAAMAGASAALAGPLTRMAFAAPTGTFDDGTDAVPPGLAGDPERVIVVGAGWAGLTVANALRNAGVDHVVLEGRDRIGGRAHTIDLGGNPVDLGCSWIHGPIGNPMSAFAEQAGIARMNADIELDAPIIRFFDAFLDGEVGLTDKGSAFFHALNFAANDSAAIADELGPGASVFDGAQVYLDRNGQSGDQRRQAEFLMRLVSEMSYGYDWTQLDLHEWAWPNHEDDYIGVGEGDMPKGGYRGLIRAIAGSGEVRLGHRVQSIEQRPGGVVVRATAGGRKVKLRGSHVVVAVPLGVLKKSSIRFEPRLPKAKREAIAKIGFGAVEKVAMAFDEPFWSDVSHTHMVNLSDHSSFELPLWIDLNRISGFPTLVSFSGGDFARQLHKLSADEALELTLTRLSEILGRDVPRPVDFTVTDWQGERFTRGAYSAVPIGVDGDDFDALAEPIAGRVLFAGEATNRKRHSTADGALSSGIREAKRLLGKSSVTLSAG